MDIVLLQSIPACPKNAIAKEAPYAGAPIHHKGC